MKENNKTKDNKKGLKVLCYSLLVAVSLTAIGLSMCNLLGYTSLVGEKGETGSKGDKGESGDPGQKGETGDKGETGETGIKGETGDQGEQGDKGATGDPGSKGEKGDKGDKGSTGSTGSDGKDADKYYNCTILKSTGGYITLDKGCAKVGETVTFTIVPENNYIFNKLFVGEQSVKDNTTYVEGEFTYSCEMVENGLVVSADFLDVGTNPVLDVDSNSIYTSISAAIAESKTNLRLLNNITLEGGEEGTGATITLNTDLTLDLNGKTLTFNEAKNGFVVNGNYLFTVKDTSTNKDGKIVVDGYGENGDSAIYITDKSKFVLESGEISMNGKNSSASNTAYAINAAYGSKIEITGGKIVSDNTAGHSKTIDLSTDADITICDATLENKKSDTDDDSYVINSSGCKGTKNIQGVTFESKANLIGLYTMSSGTQTVNFVNCTFKKEASFEYTGDSLNLKIENCTFDGQITNYKTKAISGISSKFKDITRIVTNSWLADGYSLTESPDSDGYYHLTYTTEG